MGISYTALAAEPIHGARVVELSPRPTPSDDNKDLPPPLADAGPERGKRNGSTLWLDATGSTAMGRTQAQYIWSLDNTEISRGQLAPVHLPIGRHSVELRVIDAGGHQATDETVVNIYQPRTVSVGETRHSVVKILDQVQTSTANRNVQMTPLAAADGYVYTANIEHGPHGDENGIRLYTVLRQGYQNATNGWHWNNVLVEDRTVHDPWHSSPSVAVDNDGQVHVVYNMHNTPWQYKRTAQPHAINSLGFHGQVITIPELENWKFNNRISFPTLGSAAIPGNQITYPRFEHDRNGELYLTYRFAAKPSRNFVDRMFSSGIASYNTQLGEWNAVGSPVEIAQGDADGFYDGDPRPLAFSSAPGWTAYYPQLMFDANNQLHVSSFWRQGTAGPDYRHPCFMQQQPDNSFRTLSGRTPSSPVRPHDCNSLGFSENTVFTSVFDSEMDSQGNPYIVVSPVGGDRILVTYNRDSVTWRHEPLPWGASELFLDGEENLWAVATGPRIYRRNGTTGDWYGPMGNTANDGNCLPKAVVSNDNNNAYVHTMACDSTSVSIYAISLR